MVVHTYVHYTYTMSLLGYAILISHHHPLLPITHITSKNERERKSPGALFLFTLQFRSMGINLVLVAKLPCLLSFAKIKLLYLPSALLKRQHGMQLQACHHLMGRVCVSVRECVLNLQQNTIIEKQRSTPKWGHSPRRETENQQEQREGSRAEWQS